LHRIDLPASEECQRALRGEWDPTIGDPKPPVIDTSRPGAHRSTPNQFLNAEFVELVADLFASMSHCARSFPLHDYTPLKQAMLDQYDLTRALRPQPGPKSSMMVAFGMNYKAAPLNTSVEKKHWRWMDIMEVNGTMYVRRDPSKIHGYGIMARDPITTGAFISEIVGEVVPTQEAARRLQKYENEPIGNVVDIYQRFNDSPEEAEKVKTQPPGDAFMVRLDGAWVVDATVAGSAARFVNHSCDPNAEIRVIEGIGDRRHVMLFALQEIRAGEEVCVDYGLVPVAGKPEIKCTCGSEKCCGRIDRPR
jgi:hypothetical protein